MAWLLKQFLRKHANMAFKTICLDIMTEWLKNLYPDTRVVIDSAEIFTEMSASNWSLSETCTNCKHHYTAKTLIPSGANTLQCSIIISQVML